MYVVGLDVCELLFRTDSDDGLPMMVAESGAMSKFVRLDDGPVVALSMLANVLGDDRFSLRGFVLCYIGSTGGKAALGECFDSTYFGHSIG